MEDKDLLDLLNKRIYDDNKKPQKLPPFLTVKGANIGTPGNYIVLSGLPKAGKSTFVNAILAACCNESNNVFSIEINPQYLKNKRIGYFDTESNEYDFYSNVDRIKLMAGVKKIHDKVDAFNTRIDSSQLNRELIECYLRQMKPALLIADGMLDLVNNYNDESECRMVVEWIKKITIQYNFLLIGVIHIGKKEGHTLGHFGSMLDRYAQSVLEVVKEKEFSALTMRSKYLRSAVDMDDISIQWDPKGYKEVILPKMITKEKNR